MVSDLLPFRIWLTNDFADLMFKITLAELVLFSNTQKRSHLREMGDTLVECGNDSALLSSYSAILPTCQSADGVLSFSADIHQFERFSVMLAERGCPAIRVTRVAHQPP